MLNNKKNSILPLLAWTLFVALSACSNHSGNASVNSANGEDSDTASVLSQDSSGVWTSGLSLCINYGESKFDASSDAGYIQYSQSDKNYLKGTEFELEDARRIISTDTPMQNRNEDSHDILGTFKIVSNKAEMNLIPRNPEQLIEMLLYRHKVLLSARTSKNPGLFKDKNNRAGETYFVDHGLVKGTLKKGYEYYQALKHPFSRAVYMMFMVSEIHPFLDGNGRIARVMMNAELTTADQAKIIIPTVYRDDYVGALRKLTRKAEPSAYIRMMLRAWKFSSTIAGENFDSMRSYLEECNAFKDHDQAKLKFRFP